MKKMTDKRADQSNPFSTGGGGISFEICVQTYFAIHIVTDLFSANLIEQQQLIN